MGWFYVIEEGEMHCIIVVYSIDEFISSHFQLGRCYTLSAGPAGRHGRRVESAGSKREVVFIAGVSRNEKCLGVSEERHKIVA
jgi:hypothetical protein